MVDGGSKLIKRMADDRNSISSLLFMLCIYIYWKPDCENDTSLSFRHIVCLYNFEHYATRQVKINVSFIHFDLFSFVVLKVITLFQLEIKRSLEMQSVMNYICTVI